MKQMIQISHAKAQRRKDQKVWETFAPLRLCVSLFCLVFASALHAERPVIYQLMVRHFGNTNVTNKPHGTLAENGCGKFTDINDAALNSLREIDITHVWLTGVIQQATRTDYTAIGQPADDADICKGQAGSPYAIKDYFDVCPDYAIEPAKRLEEFRELVKRCHAHGLKVILDFVPNHVSRAYRSDIRPELSFGEGDDRGQFFSTNNHFYYLRLGAPPLQLPTGGQNGCDGRFDLEHDFGRVTGNNAATWSPSSNDWFETVKLNYGVNFVHEHTGDHATENRTWRCMDAILAYWQDFGVDGFRCDMAHMIPMPFWRYALQKARERDADAYFMAEAYDNDPAKLTHGNVLDALLDAGFDAVYDDPTYDLVKAIYDGPKWANDLDALISDSPRFHRSLRYGENHDEVRLASPQEWRGLGMNVGRGVCGLLFGLGRGPVMIYNGQELGEQALGTEGHGGDDSRTTIFDYWSLPSLRNPPSEEQKQLRESYGRLLRLMNEPALAKGSVRPLNRDNSSQWLSFYARRDAESGQTFLIVTNLHGSETMKDVQVNLSAESLVWLDVKAGAFRLKDRLSDRPHSSGTRIGDIPPMTSLYFEIERGGNVVER
jgi:glycosidase